MQKRSTVWCAGVRRVWHGWPVHLRLRVWHSSSTSATRLSLHGGRGVVWSRRGADGDGQRLRLAGGDHLLGGGARGWSSQSAGDQCQRARSTLPSITRHRARHLRSGLWKLLRTDRRRQVRLLFCPVHLTGTHLESSGHTLSNLASIRLLGRPER